MLDGITYICITGCSELQEHCKQKHCITTGKRYRKTLDRLARADFCPCGNEENWVPVADYIANLEAALNRHCESEGLLLHKIEHGTKQDVDVAALFFLVDEMNARDLAPCPFCGKEWNWRIKASIGKRMVEGYAECSGCGARVGEGHIALDDDDLKPRIAAIVNARHEHTCIMVESNFRDFAVEYEHSYSCSVCCEETSCLKCISEDGDTNWVKPNFCGLCGAKVVNE